jgi:lysophospholipase L1-like esterase
MGALVSDALVLACTSLAHFGGIQMKFWRSLLCTFAGFLLMADIGRTEPLPQGNQPEPYWVGPMKKVHAKFTGKRETLACFGDSITVTMAFWAPLAYQPKGMSPEMKQALDLVKGYMKKECWAGWKGPAHGSEGGMTIRWADQNVDKWLKKLNPETAVILFGTNDLGQVLLEEYEKKTGEVVDRCLQNGTVVILTTLPPRSGRLDQARKFAEAARRVARQKKVPLIDYFAEVLKRRPTDWDGSLAKFKATPGGEYQVPTLIAGDGVHPSNPTKYQDYSDESLRHNGYALRNYLTVMAYANVIREVLQPAK